MNRNNCPASILIDAVAVISRLRDTTVVISLSDVIMSDAGNLSLALVDIQCLAAVGLRPVVVHGSGPLVGEALREAGMNDDCSAAAFDDRGLPSVDISHILAVYRSSLAGATNENLAREFEHLGGRAMTLNFESTLVLTGKLGSEPLTPDEGDAAEQGPPQVQSKIRGFVTEVDRLVIDNLCYARQVPFIPALGACSTGDRVCLVNADAAASKVAAELGATRLILFGKNIDTSGSGSMNPQRISCGDAAGKIADGRMTVQPTETVSAACHAVRSGVESAFVVDSNQPHSILLNLFTGSGQGIEIVEAG